MVVDQGYKNSGGTAMRNTYSEISLPYNDSHYQLPSFRIQNPVQMKLEQASISQRYFKERDGMDNDYYR